ncbi:MAG TPA: hypothetical protein VFS40_06390 [Gemmatimonadales bacterium]|nr:hypothetical protein [Gemmatimonadales bacterium]
MHMNTRAVTDVTISRLRQALAELGHAPASAIPEGSGGRTEEAMIRPARLVECARVEHLPVGTAEAWTEPVAFLDGTQRSELVCYVGTRPLVAAFVAAAVRERRERRLRTVLVERRRLVVGHRDALAAAAGLLEGFEIVELDQDDGETPHPVRELQRIARAVDRQRGNLELAAGDRYRQRSDAWLVVDGSLTGSPGWAADERMIGVSKSHATLPFDGADLERYLRLPAGHRTPLFEPPARSFAPVVSWALRLWPWEGRDLFHGLVRIEVAPAAATPGHADRLSRHLLAERVPLSTPDPRWDRLLYGIHAVEQYLKAGARG